MVVVATDLPEPLAAVLSWLVDQPGGLSVVPVVEDRSQPLCACYSPDALSTAVMLVGLGRFAMQDLLGSLEVKLVPEHYWPPGSAEAQTLSDTDTPADLLEILRGPRR